jgi:hypothetical protein
MNVFLFGIELLVEKREEEKDLDCQGFIRD